jgi:hypothetical protein
MDKCGDGISLGDFQEKCMGGTVLVWVLDPQDVGIAQDIAKALSRSVGLDSEASLMTLAEVAEKGGGLLGSESGGLLVLCPRGARIRVEAVDFTDAPRRAGALAGATGLRPCPL